VAERHDGRFEIITWTHSGEDVEPSPADETAQAQAA
jgi:hypothetical protein